MTLEGNYLGLIGAVVFIITISWIGYRWYNSPFQIQKRRFRWVANIVKDLKKKDVLK